MKKKNIKPLLVILLITIVVMHYSCEKTTASSNITPCPATKPNTIEGLWEGTYAVNGLSSTQSMIFSIQSNGKLIYNTKGGSDDFIGRGTWAKIGNNFTANITSVWSTSTTIGINQTLTATYDSLTGKLNNGLWQNNNTGGNGTFLVSEIN